MSKDKIVRLDEVLDASAMQDIDNWIAKYPDDQKQSAVLSTLRIVQEAHGYLTDDLMNAVAVYLDMPAIAVYEAATFYSMFELEPCGKNLINVCTNISCKLRDSDRIVGHLERRLGIGLGQTTADGKFTLRSVECLGACVNAPMMQINKDYHENLTPEQVDQILEKY